MSEVRFKRGTAAWWTTINPVLLSGEPGHERDTGKFKIGDGSTAWTGLPYIGGQDVLDWWANGNAWPTRPTVSSGSYHWVGPASAGQPPSGASGDLVDLVQGL